MLINLSPREDDLAPAGAPEPAAPETGASAFAYRRHPPVGSDSIEARAPPGLPA